ncbi:hypothetical protein MP638_002252 [Amoeboaphelidium occidentale]|nr:hypothetical protein MP638_002252 [Amoeboaphelidium occidentale]
MSLHFRWDKLDEEASLKAADTLRDFIGNSELPEWLRRLEVKDFQWGDVAPEIEIVDITDVFSAFREYTPSRKYKEQSIINSTRSSPVREYFDQTKSQNGGKRTSNSLVSSGLDKSFSSSASDMEDSISAGLSNSFGGAGGAFVPNPFDVQFIVSFKYDGNMRIGLEAEFSLNYPTFQFLSLPVAVNVTHISMSATAVIGFVGSHLHLCLLKSNDLKLGLPLESPSLNMNMEWEVGDTEKQVLRDTSKLERFVIEVLHKFIWERFVFPNFHTVELTSADDQSTGGVD